MSNRTGHTMDYQETAREFSMGDVVAPFEMLSNATGRVKAVWPAIGMVDVQYPNGVRRYPVEDLQLIRDGSPVPTNESSQVPAASSKTSARRVAEAYVKHAVYWAARDRKYRATRAEIEARTYNCPQCRKRGAESTLRRAIYKRSEGRSDRLLGCPECMFLVKQSDLIGCHYNEPCDEGAA